MTYSEQNKFVSNEVIKDMAIKLMNAIKKILARQPS